MDDTSREQQEGDNRTEDLGMTYFETTDFEVDTNDADIRLAEELYRMPADDRRRVEEEIHGVGSLARTETPEMIADSLRLFQTEIDCFHVKRAYDDALVINSEYIFDRDFRLRFLRATLFDVSKAARRFCSHLDLLLEKYGPCALQRPLRYSDMSKSGRDLLKNGTIQVLPSRDRAGRLVVVLQGSMAHATIQCRVRFLSDARPELPTSYTSSTVCISHDLNRISS